MFGESAPRAPCEGIRAGRSGEVIASQRRWPRVLPAPRCLPSVLGRPGSPPAPRYPRQAARLGSVRQGWLCWRGRGQRNPGSAATGAPLSRLKLQPVSCPSHVRRAAGTGHGWQAVLPPDSAHPPRAGCPLQAGEAQGASLLFNFSHSWPPCWTLISICWAPKPPTRRGQTRGINSFQLLPGHCSHDKNA